MDSFEFNKIAGAVLAVVLFTMGLNTFASAIFSPKMPATPGWALPAASEAPADSGPAAAAAEPLGVMLAKADAGRGATVAKDCLSCHIFDKDGPKKTGPSLYNVVGRKIGGMDFKYSPDMMEYAGKTKEWSFEALDAFLTNPKKVVAKTAMTYAGVPNAAKRADLLAYLRSRADTPVDLPK